MYYFLKTVPRRRRYTEALLDAILLCYNILMNDNFYFLNTLSKKKELFTPLSPDKVTFYHCGPTVYWTQHIGNMRGMVMADLIRRSLEYGGYNVEYVMNYTDVGHLSGDNEGDADMGVDRMEKAAERESKSPQEIADFYIAQFETDLHKLHVKPAFKNPRATQYIKEMKEMVSKLLDDGFAYQTELAIYFDTSKADDYYALSGQKADQLQSHTGHGDVADTNKRNPTDFAVWFFKAGAHANALQTWSNPFSETPGFPGWHIECSAMAKRLLGETIDIHMGGIEHVPIHHTNEIAQSEAANGVPFAHYWLHNEHLLVDGKKMSKSDGTSYTIADIEAHGYSALDLRYFFLQSHYRSKQNFTWEALEASKTARLRLVGKLAAICPHPQGGTFTASGKYFEKFKDALSDDINIPAALAIVNEAMKDSEIEDGVKWSTVIAFDKVLGLSLRENSSLYADIDITPEVANLIGRRASARKQKTKEGYDLADDIRREIESLGFDVKDGPDGGQQITKK